MALQFSTFTIPDSLYMELEESSSLLIWSFPSDGKVDLLFGFLQLLRQFLFGYTFRLTFHLKVFMFVLLFHILKLSTSSRMQVEGP